MANTRELRRRIRSVKNTSQITKAMEMVAATKMRKAQLQAVAGRPYFETLNFSLTNLLENIQTELHRLLQQNTSTKKAVVLLSTDKSLCGALNTNTFRAMQGFLSASKGDYIFFTVGKKGRNFIVNTGRNLEADFENPELVSSRQSRQIGHALIDLFTANKIGEAYIVYPGFVSTLRQEPKIVKILPVNVDELIAQITPAKKEKSQKMDFVFEPSVSELLDFILVHSVQIKIYQALVELKASEHSARMIAMQNATNNAKELVADLQLMYNQTRQQAITNELLEITSASAALE